MTARPRKPLLVNLAWVVGGFLVLIVAYVLSLGPMLWFAHRHDVPYATWYVYYPILKLWGSEFIPWDLQELYYEDYLQWWSDYLPYRFLLDNGLV